MERLLDYFIPENYQLDLFIDKTKKLLKGVVKITGQALKPEIRLNSVDNKLKFVKINGENFDFKLEDNVLSVADAPLGVLTLEVGYDRALNENMQGAYLSTYKYNGKEETIVSTQFESHYAREAFPCLDEPEAKATFDLSITIPDGDDIVLANTELLSKNGQTYVFAQTPRMSTYLLAFVIGKFNSRTVTNAHGVKITSYAPLNQDPSSLDFANKIAAASLDYYDDLFKTPYPLKKLDQVAIPDFEAGAMENWGLVTYRESMFLVPKTAPVATKKTVALTVSHELSHQWFGNLVTMKWWDDLWLNESFASVMEYFATDHICPDFNIWEDFFTGDCLAALRRDCLSGVQSVKQPVSDPSEIATLFDGAIVYAKGARLMLMLIRLMTPSKFFKGIKDYFEKFKYKNTVGDDLWDCLTPYTNFDVKTFMNAWISQPGYPVLTDENQQRFLLSGEDSPEVYPLPEIKDDMSGHYLINLSGPEFRESLDNFGSLSLEQKLRLLIDRDLLAKTPLVSSGSLVELVEKFKLESSASVWEVVSTIIGSLKLFFFPDIPEEEKFRAFVYDLVKPRLDSLGLVPRKNESLNDLELRNTLISLGLYSRNPEFLSTLSEKYSEDYSSLDPELRADALFAKLLTSESEVFEKYLETYQKTSDPDLKFELLFALTEVENPEHIEKMLSLLEAPKIVKPQDHLYLFIYLRRNKNIKEKAFDWLLENWAYVEKISGEKSLEDYPRLLASTIKTLAEKEKFFGFFDQHSENPVLKRTLKIAENEIDSRLKLIALDQKSVFNALNRLKS
ncbi:M1 family metallopeptidase [Candidatus Saccharibacteria bacterium]|nr:M1 family metallopeptidase [Candidatus Saccharibacteria bacterium]